MDYMALCAKLEEAKFNQLSDSQALATIRAEVVRVKRLVPVVEVKQWAIENQIYAPIIIGQQSENEQLKMLCISIAGWIDDVGGRVQNANLDIQAAQAMMHGLVAFEIASAQQIESLKALQWVEVSWEVANNCQGLEVGHIQSARGMI